MDYKGYELFTDVEDADLQARNRAVVLWNIFETNAKNGKASPKGVVDMIGYTKNVPGDQRKAMLHKFSEILRGTEAVQ